jgi:hypothetical protein
MIYCDKYYKLADKVKEKCSGYLFTIFIRESLIVGSEKSVST